MQRLHFNDRIIDGLKAPGVYYDQSTKAFGIRVGKSTKAFFCVKDGGRRIALGRYPETTLQNARNRAKRLLLDGHTIKPSLSLFEALEVYLTAYIQPNYRPNTARKTELLLKHIGALGKRNLSTLKTSDITDILDRLSPSQANHVFGALRTFFNWCEKRDYCASPLRKLTKPHREKTRSRVLSAEELTRIWKACENDSFGKIVRLLMLTGQRRGEIAAMQRSWLADDVVTFPASITKNGKEHSIPQCELTRELVDVEAFNDNQHLFASSKTGTIITGWAKLKSALDKRCGVRGWTLHDLRRTWSTRSAELGTPPHVIEAVLNHLTGTISPLARIYNRAKYQSEMRDALQTYDAYISSLISQT